MTTLRTISSAFLLALLACSEAVITDDEPTPDAGDIAPDGGIIGLGDAGPGDAGVEVRPPNTVRISGRTLRLDGFMAGIDPPLAVAAQVRTVGTAVIEEVSSDALGNYEIDVPQDGQLILSASVPGDYLTSYASVTVGAQDLPGRNFYIAYGVHIDQLGTAFGVDIDQTFECHPPNQGQCRYAVVVGRVVDDGTEGNGTPAPQAGVAQDDFVLRGNGDSNWYVKGPYFFNGQSGAPAPNADETARYFDNARNAYRGGLFVVYVEVPIGGSALFELSAASLAGGPQTRYFGPATFQAYAGGFTWTTVRETGIPVQPPDPPPLEDVDFATQIYPMFLPVAQGGLGCQGCHTNQGGQNPSGGLNLYGGPAQAYQALNPNQYPQRVNVQNPGASYLLVRPLFEPVGPQDHPILAFYSDQDPGYRAIYSWIAEGAEYDGIIPPPPVSFYNDVRPILYEPIGNGGAGCYNCHVDGEDANTAPGGAYFGGDGNALHLVLTAQTPSDNGNTGEQYRVNIAAPAQSLLLLNPLAGSPEPHPAKLFNGVLDPRYQTIYQWIQGGAVNDTP